MEAIFSQSCAAIEDQYRRLGYQLGWRFLASSRSTLTRNTPMALITLNPGGSVDRPDHGRESSEEGSAYVVESWGRDDTPGGAPLQTQVQRLFSRLANLQGSGMSGDDLLNKSLAAYFVPFRSPTFNALSHPQEALAFASRLWSGLFDEIDPDLIITIDQRTTQRLAHILSKKLGTLPTRQPFPIGWGTYRAELLVFNSSGMRRAILRLPHLSRFRIFGRPQSEPYVEPIIQAVARFC